MYENEEMPAGTTDMTSMEREFIKKYEQLPLLWKKDHPDYSNKHRRNLAYNELLPILRTFLPNANVYNVRLKINILRSSYRKELKKYLASKSITVDGEIYYTHIPPSWKFEAMKFLKDLNDKDHSEIVIEESVNDESFNEVEDQELVYLEEPENVESGTEQDNNPPSPIFIGESPVIFKSNPRKRVKKQEDHILGRECTAVSSNVKCKLQRMNSEQRCFAEQLINKVLMRGLKQSLTEETDLMDSVFLVQHKTEKD